jgi:hypothetical protein
LFNATEHKYKQMNKKIALGISLFAFVLISTLGCNKEAGIGGSSTITGTVMGFDYNPATGDSTFYELLDERVHIIYGSDQSLPYQDSYKSSWNGKYQFDYLKKGTYSVFAYEKCSTCDNGKQAVFATVEITKNGTEIDLGDLNLLQSE